MCSFMSKHTVLICASFQKATVLKNQNILYTDDPQKKFDNKGHIMTWWNGRHEHQVM
jgi:hypothetical protein